MRSLPVVCLSLFLGYALLFAASGAIAATNDDPSSPDLKARMMNISALGGFVNEREDAERFERQPASIFSQRAKAAENTVKDAEAAARAYQKSLENNDPIAEQKALQSLKDNPAAIHILTRSSTLSASALHALEKKLATRKPSLNLGLTPADIALNAEHAKKMEKAQALIDDLRKAVTSGDDVAKKAATLELLNNTEARFLMKGDDIEGPLKNAYNELTEAHRTKPLIDGTADELNKASFTKNGVEQPKYVVVENGVEREIRPSDFKKVSGKDTSAPGMDLDFYNDVTIIDKETGRPIKRGAINKAMESSADRLGIDTIRQQINVTGLDSPENYVLRKNETVKEMLERVAREKSMSVEEAERAYRVALHKISESPSLQQQAYSAQKEYDRFTKHLLEKEGQGFEIPRAFNTPHPEAKLTGMEIIDKLSKGEIDPGTARALFRKASGGVEIDDAMRKIAGWSEFVSQRAAAKGAKKIVVSPENLGFVERQMQNLQNSKIFAAAQGKWDAVKKSGVGKVFQNQLGHVKNSWLLKSLPGLNVLGTALDGVMAAGEYSKHMMEEMEHSETTGTRVRKDVVIVRTVETMLIEPVEMLFSLAGKGIEAGAIKTGQWMERVGNDIANLSDVAKKKGWDTAFGNLMYDAFVAPAIGGASLAAKGGGFAWGGIKYVLSNPLETLATIGKPFEYITEYAYREDDIFRENSKEFRDQLFATADSFAKRADNLQKTISDFKDFVRKTYPESPEFSGKLKKAIEDYEKSYHKLAEDYVKWRTNLNQRHGGVHHNTIAQVLPDIKPQLAKIFALPQNLMDVIDAQFIKGLLSTVELILYDAESGEPVAAKGWVQFNSPGVELVCRNAESNTFTCKDIPPGTHQMRVKVGDYADFQRSVTIKPTSRRHYRQPVRLTAEAPTWAYITVTVRDRETQEPIPGAKVIFTSDNGADVKPPSRTSTGALQITQVLNGHVVVSAEAAGYEGDSEELIINTRKETQHQITLYLQPDGSAKKKPETEEPEPASGSFDCNQLKVTTNVNFSTWSCCRDDIERERAEAMCRGIERQASSQKWQIQMKITEAIRAQEGGSYNSGADYSDYPTPYGTLREVDQCASSQVDDLCRKLGAPRSGKPPEKKKEEPKKDDAKQRQAKACFESKRQMIENAKKTNSDGDGGNFLIYASKSCQDAHKKCEDDVFQAGVKCRGKATTDAAIKNCNRQVTLGWEECAYNEVVCSESAIKQQCGLEK